MSNRQSVYLYRQPECTPTIACDAIIQLESRYSFPSPEVAG